jgi:hypothetical protein
MRKHEKVIKKKGENGQTGGKHFISLGPMYHFSFGFPQKLMVF